MKRSWRARTGICTDVAGLAHDLVEKEQFTCFGHHDQRRIVRGADQPLENRARGRAELEAIADVEPELNQPHAEPEVSAARVLLSQVAPLQQCVDESVRARASDGQPSTDLGKSEPLRLGREQLEDVEYAVGRFDRVGGSRDCQRRHRGCCTGNGATSSNVLGSIGRPCRETILTTLPLVSTRGRWVHTPERHSCIRYRLYDNVHPSATHGVGRTRGGGRKAA